MSKACHRCASDVEGCFRRAVERGMLRRRKVLHEPDVLGPGKLFRILRASENELLFRKTMRRLDEELLQHSLTIGRVGSEIRKIRFVSRRTRCRLVQLRIDAAIERRDAPGSQERAQFIKSTAANIAQHQIEISESVAWNVID